LKLGKQADAAKLPKIFFVNWFRRDDGGRYLWPGFGENSRVLKWVFERIDGRSSATRTPVGLVPTADAIDTTALDVPKTDLEEVLRFDAAGWSAAVPQIKEHYAKFGAHLPSELHASLATLEHELAK